MLRHFTPIAYRPFISFIKQRDKQVLPIEKTQKDVLEQTFDQQSVRYGWHQRNEWLEEHIVSMNGKEIMLYHHLPSEEIGRAFEKSMMRLYGFHGYWDYQDTHQQMTREELYGHLERGRHWMVQDGSAYYRHNDEILHIAFTQNEGAWLFTLQETSDKQTCLKDEAFVEEASDGIQEWFSCIR